MVLFTIYIIRFHWSKNAKLCCFLRGECLLFNGKQEHCLSFLYILTSHNGNLRLPSLRYIALGMGVFISCFTTRNQNLYQELPAEMRSSPGSFTNPTASWKPIPAALTYSRCLPPFELRIERGASSGKSQQCYIFCRAEILKALIPNKLCLIIIIAGTLLLLLQRLFKYYKDCGGLHLTVHLFIH